MNILRHDEIRDENESQQLLRGTSILIAEDDEHIREFLTFYLESCGATVSSAENGLESFLKALDGKFNVILMDLNLPVMNGIASIKKMRAAGYVGPVIAMSANDEKSKSLECIQGGFDDFVSKPFDLDLVVKKLVYWKNNLLKSELRVLH
jgi:CheY-like chemotaxis protein